MEFTDVTAYNGRLTDSTYVDATVFGNIYKTLFMGRVTTDTVSFPRIEDIAHRWFNYRNDLNQNEKSPVLVLSGLYYQYSRIDEKALSENKIKVHDNRYYDHYIDNEWQNPYEKMQTIAFALPIKNLNRRNFEVTLPEDMLLSNNEREIKTIEIDFADGRGYRELVPGQKLNVSYAENGIYRWSFRTTLMDDLQLFSGIIIALNEYTNPYQEDVFIAGPGSSFWNAKRGAMLRINYAPGHNGQIKKPLIVAEGFDAGSILYPETSEGDRTISDLKEDVTLAGNNLFNLLFNGNHQYDIIYIDWQNGTHNIKHNSEVLRNVIKWVNGKKRQAGSTEKNVLLGQSMGGLISRYTLAKMEKVYNENHDVRLFIAHDSPMRGANTPLGTQYFTRHIYSQYVSSPALYGLGEIVIPLFFDLANLISDAINLFGGETSVDTYISPDTALTIQDTPAAVQMNYHYVDMFSNPTEIFHKAWQQEFDAMGYPQNSRNIAISNGNECSFGHGFEPGDKIIDLHQKQKFSFLGNLLMMVATPVIGSLLNQPGLILIGILPGSSSYRYDFDVHTNPSRYNTKRKVYYGRISYTKKILGVPFTIPITERTKHAPYGYLPFDSYSGGFYNITSATNNIPINLANSIFVNPRYGFIPVASALDIRRNNTEPNHEDYLRKYYGGTVPYTGLSSGFDNFIVDYNKGNITNNRHISFQARNGNWLANELNNVTANTANCSYVCETEIIGPEVLCDTAIFSVPEGASFYNWSITEGNGMVQSTSGNGTNQFTLKRRGGDGTIKIQVTFGDYNQTCGNVTLTKEIKTGSKPYFEEKIPIGNQNGYDPNGLSILLEDGSACNKVQFQVIFNSYLPIVEYEIENTTTQVLCFHNGDGIFILNAICNKKFTGNVRARNACGWSDWKYIEHYINRCTNDCPPPPNYTIGENFILTPNPVFQGLLEVKVKYGAPWFTINSLVPNPMYPGLEGGSGGITNFNPTVNIDIFNQSGVLVLSFPNSQLPITLNISSLPAGNYIVQMQHLGQTESHTIIKQ